MAGSSRFGCRRPRTSGRRRSSGWWRPWSGALAREFPHTSILPGGTLYAFGSGRPLPADAEPLIERLASRRLTPRLMTPPYLRYLYGNDRRDDVTRMLASAGAGIVNRDAAPVAYGYAAMLWLSKFYPALAASMADVRVGGADVHRRGARPGHCRRGVVGAPHASPRRAGSRCWSSARHRWRIESVALLQYQVANGVMFVNVGVLLTCFMAGLSVRRLAGRRCLQPAAAVGTAVEAPGVARLHGGARIRADPRTIAPGPRSPRVPCSSSPVERWASSSAP